MYPIALLGLLSLLAIGVFGIVALTGKRGSSRALVASTVLVAFGLLVLAAGFIGYQVGLSQMEAAVAMVNPADKATILARGTSEARSCVVFGTAASLPSLLVGVGLFGFGLARLKRDPMAAL
jgi:hypothetical protein